MMNKLINSKLLELDKLATQFAQKYAYKRSLFKVLKTSDSRIFKAIIGPRGMGKTVLLQQLRLNTPNAFYLSADTCAPDLDLFELIKVLKQEYGFATFFVDEIHFNKNYSKALKNIFDFLDVKLFFTSSVALSLVNSSYDLSRRVELHELHLFPFWEYLELQGHEVGELTLDDLLNDNVDNKWRRYSSYFEKYLEGGALPYSRLGGDVIQGQRNIIEAIIEKDIPSVFPITSDDIFHLKKTVEFIALSSVDGVNYSSLSSNLGITKYKAQQYVSLLANAFILNVSTPHGANVSKEPKVLLYLPNRLVYADYSQALGGIREDFATTMFRSLGLEYSYLKTNKGKKTPDFYFQFKGKKVVCEIGGKSKGHSQFKDLSNYDKKIVFKHTNEFKEGDLPLFLLGCIRQL